MNLSLAKRMLLAVTGFMSIICAIGFASSQVQYRPWGVPQHRLEEYKQKVAVLQKRQAMIENSTDGPLPAVYLAEREFDFGTVDPGSTNEHAFVIENRGEAPLALLAGETSCKCTLSALEETIVQPGEATHVTLTWNAGQQQREHYRQFARIRTNDPQQPEISVAVLGSIRKRLGFDPPALVANRVTPDESIELHTVVYSQLYDDFRIESVDSRLESFSYFVDPVFPELLDEMGAKSGYRLTVVVPAAEAGKTADDRLAVTVRPPGGGKAYQEEIALRATVLPRLAFYGGKLDSRYGLDLGVLEQGETGEQRILVRVRGDSREKAIEILELDPACLRATLEDYKPEQGLYRLTVSVAADAKPVAFRASQEIGYVAVGNRDDVMLQKLLPVRGQIIPRVE